MRSKTCLATLLLISPLIRSHAQGTWTQQSDFGGTARTIAVGFAIGDKGYIGTGLGRDDIGNVIALSSFRQYDPSTNTWTRKAHLPGPPQERLAYAVGFSIGSKGYIVTGSHLGLTYSREVAEYDPVTDIWTRKADFPGAGRYDAVGFSIGDKGYMGLGVGSFDHTLSDFWEYDPATGTWTQKADFGGGPRFRPVGFSIGSKGYIGTGESNGRQYKDFWEYDPATDTWTQRADYAGEAILFAVGFAINGKGYIGEGWMPPSTIYNGFWEYDPTLDTWTRVADFPGTPRSGAVAFAIGDYAYFGTGGFAGFAPTLYKDFWQFTPQ